MSFDRDLIAARLLSGRRGLSRQDKEDVLEAVLGHASDLAPVEPPSTSRWGWIGILGALAAASLVLVIAPRAVHRSPEGEFTARGGTSEPGLTVLCSEGFTPGECAEGRSLVFEVADRGGWTHVGLFAERPDGAILWYVPEAGGRSIALELEGEMSLVPREVELGSEHPPGEYTLVAVLSRRPLTRAEIRHAAERSGKVLAPPGIRVLERKLTIR